ncbi:MAG: glycoside hydrolase [Clostridia bacterium]|nr:glycoside hydrolase [Clostridia bacterium]
MKKVFAALLASCMLIAMCPASMAASHVTVHVDAADTSPFGAFEGWGTSLCWWASHFGDLPEDERKALVAAFFDEETGLGLNIARYNIGGGDDPTHNHLRSDGRAVPGYMNKDGSYNFDADQNQVNILKDAISYGCDIVEAFSNSPPYFMTKSGCTSGGEDPSVNNIDPAMFDEFADYLTEVVLYLRDKQGIEVDTLEPMNEPDTNYWKAGGSQEGCHIDAEDHSALIVAVDKALKAKGLTQTAVAAADETSVDTMLGYLPLYTEEAKAALGQLNVHTYWASNYAGLRDLAVDWGKKLYMSETDYDRAIGTNAGEMGPALWFSNKITTDLRSLEAAAWCVWQVTGPAYSGSNSDRGYWYLSQYDRANKRLDLFKKYYAFAHYTKFIRPGYYLMATDSPDVLAAYDRVSGKIVLVATNYKPYDMTFDFNLSGFASSAAVVEAYRTSKTQNLEKITDGTLIGNTLKTTLLQNTITTYVLSPQTPPSGTLYGMSIKEAGGATSTFSGKTLSFSASFLPAEQPDAKLVWSVSAPEGASVPASVNENGVVTVTGQGKFTVKAALESNLAIYSTLDISSVGEGSVVQIINKHSSLALAVNSDGTLIQTAPSDASNQYWKMMRSYAGYMFINLKTSQALDGGISLHTSKLTAGIPQMWKIKDASGGYMLENAETHKVADVFDSSMSDGGKVDMYDSNGGDNQIWNFVLSEREAVLETEEELSGTKISASVHSGTAPYLQDENAAFDKALDNDFETYFDAADASESSVVFDLGEASAPLTLFKYCPRYGYAWRMLGAELYGSNDNSTWTKIASIETEPSESVWNSLYIENDTSYRYIKYVTPKDGYCNIAEAEFWSYPLTVTAQLHDKLTISVKNYSGPKKLTLTITYYKDGIAAQTDTLTKDAGRFSTVDFESEIRTGFDSAVISIDNVYSAYIHF